MNRITDYKKLQDDIVAWIKDYAVTNNIKSLVVGVSGGIDSAVVSTLCAMTGLPTRLCVIDINSNKDHIKLAYGHSDLLSRIYSNSSMCLRDFTPVLDAFIAAIQYEDPYDHTIANIKSRLRMTMLYAISSDKYGMVVGTGNKIEDFGIGFYTKYGDGGVDISPIADLYKTEVRELGRYMGISQEILDAHPTDGLWTDGRTDEQQIGATYEELEWAMEWKGDDHTLIPREWEVVQIYKKLHSKNQHKMLPIPIYKLPI